MTQTVLLIDKNPRAFAPLVEHLRSIGFRVQVGDEKMSADEQVMRIRPHAVLLRKRNKTARKQIEGNMRVSDVPIVAVKSARRAIEENVGLIQMALFEESLRRLR